MHDASCWRQSCATHHAGVSHALSHERMHAYKCRRVIVHEDVRVATAMIAIARPRPRTARNRSIDRGQRMQNLACWRVSACDFADNHNHVRLSLPPTFCDILDVFDGYCASMSGAYGLPGGCRH